MKINFFQTERPKEMKAWQDCQWRREACGLEACPICGRIIKDRNRHLRKGDDPDSAEAVIEDVGKIFDETLSLLKEHASEMGVDLDNFEDFEMPQPPQLETYPIYNEIYAWRHGLQEIINSSDEIINAWVHTEAGRDLMWYANTLMAKTARQLDNIWEAEQGGKYADLERRYNGYVLHEVFLILDKALNTLFLDKGFYSGKFNLARMSLNGIYEKLKN